LVLKSDFKVVKTTNKLALQKIFFNLTQIKRQVLE